ncbi:uncharacterized protein LOC107266718 isoform X3 [Cephus cinctus]|uniref:Uncharacterized protein LOC107266718 isoform X3 n=1 Tax=Cephus cinctus TaxID=211228 RepID=A0AAJ7RF77_CEPCN|nr:uncharacterized protein LOC107266718 isoform X3 [Cephus cinctus]
MKLLQYRVAASVEVHFENKDGGFFLKHTPRQYYPTQPDSLSGGAGSSGSSTGTVPGTASGTASVLSPPGCILSIDKFTVFQTSEPVSVRASYGPFSTKQTVPARYIVPDPLDMLPGLGSPVATSGADKSVNGSSSGSVSGGTNGSGNAKRKQNVNGSGSTSSSAAALLDAQELSARHLDMSAHLVRGNVPRDSPVLRVLFHAGSEAVGRRQLLLARHQRVCVVLHASLPGRPSLTAACSPDGEDGVCLAQITIPASWWPPLPPPDASGRVKVTKSLPRLVQVAYSVLEPRTEGDAISCQPRVQIQPVTPLGQIPLSPNRAAYKELSSDESLILLVPHGPLYPRSRLHVPAFLQPRSGAPPIVALVLRARVKSSVRILEASSSSPDWIVDSEINAKNTAATFTARRKENVSRSPNTLTTAEEVLTMLLEASEEGASGSWDGGRIVWSVRYAFEGEEDNASLAGGWLSGQQQQHHHHHHVERRKLQARLEIQKDDIQAVLPISKNWEVMNTAVLTHRQVSQAMKVFIVSQAGKVADVTLQSSCHSEDESVLKVSSSCSSVYVDGSEIRGSSNASVLVKYGTYTGLARFTVWMPEFPLDVTVMDTRLSQIKGWKVPEEHSIAKNKRSLNSSASKSDETYADEVTAAPSEHLFHADENAVDENRESQRNNDAVEKNADSRIQRREISDSKERRERRRRRRRSAAGGDQESRMSRNGNSERWIEPDGNSIDRTPNCRLRFQQSTVDIYARFVAADHDSGRVSYFVNRRTMLRVTDLVVGLLRVSDPRIATLEGKIVQGRGVGRTEVQVLSPITGRVIGAKEVRVGSDRVSVAHLSVRVVSGLQLTISPDTAIENGYVAETSVTRWLTAQYQEGLLDIDIEYSDGSHTPLREIAATDYKIQVESEETEVVAVAPPVASHHPRVIAIGEGRGDLLRVTLLLVDVCQMSNRRSKSSSSKAAAAPLATASANVEVKFASSNLTNRPEFVQNDGGGTVGSHKEHKTGRENGDLHDIVIGIPLRDENNYEPTVQARQHHTAIANGMSSGGLDGVGIMHEGGPRMTQLKIGMYVLLAAFCFAIIVFVVSCVVYASKFKPQPPDSPLPSIPVLGAARAAARQLAPAGRPRESTTNAHDWVWLGRATLERAACAPQQVRLTANPLATEPLVDNDNENEDTVTAAELGTSFDNPNHIELPSSLRISGDGSAAAITGASACTTTSTVPIDTTTYCKKDKTPRSLSGKANLHVSAAKTSITRNDNARNCANVVSGRNEDDDDNRSTDDDIPPPLPPHGVPAVATATTTTSTMTTITLSGDLSNGNIRGNGNGSGDVFGKVFGKSSTNNYVNGNASEHPQIKAKSGSNSSRNAIEEYKPPVPPHRNREVWTKAGMDQKKSRHRSSSGSHGNQRHASSGKHHSRSHHHHHHSKNKTESSRENEAEFVELRNHEEKRAKDKSKEVKRATIVGNPMYSSQEQEEMALDDLNLGMDYDQIMHYFDNLKESNA